MDFVNPTLIWFIVGVILLLLEFAVPGVILFFFGCGAILTSIFAWFGLDSFTFQLLIFLVSSIGMLVFLRKRFHKYLKGRVSGENDFSDFSGEFIGKKAKVVKEIKPNSTEGRILFEGSKWTAISDETLKENETVEIIEKNNITLKVKSLS